MIRQKFKTTTVRLENDLLKIATKVGLKILIFQDPKQQMPHFQTILKNTSFKLDKSTKSTWKLNYNYKKYSGTTKILFRNGFDSSKPTFIYHHGLGDPIPTLQLRTVINPKDHYKYNLVIIKASNHKRTKTLRLMCVSSFMNLATTFCASVLAVNELVNYHTSNSSKPIILTGISMGGMISSLHYFYFNSADYYFPIIAYPNIGEVLMDKIYKNIVANQKKLKKNKSITNCFKIPKNLKDKSKTKIFPILGKRDRIVNYQKSKKFWRGYKVKTIPTGHFSVVAAGKEIRSYINSKVNY